MWLRLSISALMSVCLFAQSAPTDVFEKGPPDVEEALRARVSKFFQAHVDGKFRQAEEVIAEDSKDFFYNMKKQKYFGFEIVKINYEENFTKAVVVTKVEVDWKTVRAGTLRVKPPMNTLWRVDNGQWCWYVKSEKEWETPFGAMHPGPSNGSIIDNMKGVDPKVVQGSVRINKNELRLSSFEKSTAELSVTNGLPGQVKLDVGLPSVPGLTASFDKKTLAKDEVAKLTFTYEPPDQQPKSTRVAQVLVEPTNQKILVRLSFAVPPGQQPQVPAGMPREPVKR